MRIGSTTIAFAGCLALLSGTTVLADPSSQTIAPEVQPTAAAVVPDSGSLICVRKPAMTGSLLTPKAECHTAADWKELHGEASTSGINNTQRFKTIQRPTIVGNPTGR